MRPYCLASSSAGNCYILEFDVNGVPTQIMVECGIPYSELKRRIINESLDLTNIRACLITHAHSDHCKAAKDISRIGIPLFANSATLSAIGVKGNELVDFKPYKVCEGVYAMPFPVEHDIEGAIGFIIKTKDECVIFINDHKRWTCNLAKFKPNYVFIECNYFHKMVYAQVHELENKTFRTQEEEQRLAQHKRNVNAHCSLNGTIKGLKKLNLDKCRAIFLMHLSDRYANEFKMKREVMLETRIQTMVCGKNGGIK